MGLVRGRGRGRGGILKARSRGSPMKPPPLMGRFAPPPRMGLRPREMPVPPLMPRMRPPPPGMRPPLPPPPRPHPPMLRPPRPPLPPPYHPPPPVRGHLPPPLPPRPPVPPPSLLRARGQRLPLPPPPMHGMKPPGLRPPGPPMHGKRGALAFRGARRKLKPRKMEMSEDNDINKPWVTEAMKNEIQKKHKLYQKAKKSNDSMDWEEFKDQRNRVTTMIREAKLEYIGSHPEERDDQFYCGMCDRQFKSAELLEEHNTEHETCGRDGCTFTAHPKVVAKHVEAQHNTGLYKKIGNLYTPEAIAQWIAERKRNFPTKDNIERKRLAKEEKMKRGELLEDNRKLFNRDASNRQKGGRSAKRRRVRRQQLHDPLQLSEDDEEEEIHFRWKIKAFPGLEAALGEKEDPPVSEKDQDHYSDDEWDAPSTSEAAPAVVSKVLSILQAQYGSDESSVEDEIPEVVNAVQPPAVKVEQPPAVDVEQPLAVSNDDAPEEVPIMHQPMDQGEAAQQPQEEESSFHKRKRQHKGKRNPQPENKERPKPAARPVFQRKRKSTLLEKLLNKEILHERNVILQCVRYVVREDFFGIGKPKPANRSTKILQQCIRYICQKKFFDNSDSACSLSC